MTLLQIISAVGQFIHSEKVKEQRNKRVNDVYQEKSIFQSSLTPLITPLITTRLKRLD